jgi:hypothetical protein
VAITNVWGAFFRSTDERSKKPKASSLLKAEFTFQQGFTIVDVLTGALAIPGMWVAAYKLPARGTCEDITRAWDRMVFPGARS